MNLRISNITQDLDGKQHLLKDYDQIQKLTNISKNLKSDILVINFQQVTKSKITNLSISSNFQIMNIFEYFIIKLINVRLYLTKNHHEFSYKIYTTSRNGGLYQIILVKQKLQYQIRDLKKDQLQFGQFNYMSSKSALITSFQLKHKYYYFANVIFDHNELDMNNQYEQVINYVLYNQSNQRIQDQFFIAGNFNSRISEQKINYDEYNNQIQTQNNKDTQQENIMTYFERYDYLNQFKSQPKSTYKIEEAQNQSVEGYINFNPTQINYEHEDQVNKSDKFVCCAWTDRIILMQNKKYDKFFKSLKQIDQNEDQNYAQKFNEKMTQIQRSIDDIDLSSHKPVEFSINIEKNVHFQQG